MKKSLVSLGLLGVCMLSNAQVGIGTATPNATLDVVKSTTNPTTTKDGIIPPNVTKLELANKAAGTYGIEQRGTMVYVVDATGGATGTSLAQVPYIKAAGYYYFDGTLWNPIAGAVQKVTGVMVAPASNIQLLGGGTGPLIQNSTINLDNSGTTYHLGSYIDLDPGKWEVETNVLIEIQHAVTGLNNIYTKFSFTETSNLATGVTRTTDIPTGSSFLIGGLMFVFGAASGNSNPNYAVVNGKIVIVNSSTVKKRYYLMYQQGIRKYSNFQTTTITNGIQVAETTTTSPAYPKYYAIGSSSHGENYISAMRIQ